MKKDPTIPRDNEPDQWRLAVPEQRSYLVEVLHWFTYRNIGLERSWKKEEVLTWELIQALRILPHSMFLAQLLRSIAELSSESAAAAEPLLSAERISVFPFPSLKLTGEKRNCRSDIGFGLAGKPTVWVEVKTAPFKVEELREQLELQRAAMSAMFPSDPFTLITLLPEYLALPEVPNLSWQTVKRVFEDGIRGLQGAVLSADIRHGYEQLADELAKRIESHPNGIADLGK